ncbi:MAG: hypothetical protein PVI85_08725, partial [Methyloceanibacter sp.]
MSKGRPADKLPLPVEDDNLNSDRLARHNLQRRALSGARHFVAKRNPVRHSMAECFGRGIGGFDPGGQVSRASGGFGKSRQGIEV